MAVVDRGIRSISIGHHRTFDYQFCTAFPSRSHERRHAILLRPRAGYVQPSPWLAIFNKNVELMHTLMSELGLSPVSRSRVSTTRRVGPKPWEFPRGDVGGESSDLHRLKRVTAQAA